MKVSFLDQRANLTQLSGPSPSATSTETMRGVDADDHVEEDEHQELAGFLALGPSLRTDLPPPLLVIVGAHLGDLSRHLFLGHRPAAPLLLLPVNAVQDFHHCGPGLWSGRLHGHGDTTGRQSQLLFQVQGHAVGLERGLDGDRRCRHGSALPAQERKDACSVGLPYPLLLVSYPIRGTSATVQTQLGSPGKMRENGHALDNSLTPCALRRKSVVASSLHEHGPNGCHRQIEMEQVIAQWDKSILQIEPFRLIIL